MKRLLLVKVSLGLKYVFGIENLCRGYDRYFSQWHGKDTSRVGPLECERGKYTYMKEWYDSADIIPFECVNVPVPRGYHEVLTTMFGDYMVMRQISSLHRALMFDPEVPYNRYMQ